MKLNDQGCVQRKLREVDLSGQRALLKHTDPAAEIKKKRQSNA